MYKHLVIVVALSSLCCFLYGILNVIWDVERNACRMTYMYQLPTFIKLDVDGGDRFPKYNLFTYAEGPLIENARARKFTGAPVIFIPGNSGSYKQGRSLASIALRKGLDHDQGHHLDYFLVDYKEELSALFGGYLETQREFLKKSIFTILKLYNHLPNAPKQVVLIGHSMGGKVAQSLLTDETVAEKINTIIFIATPIDQPVINYDVHMNAIYRDTNNYLAWKRSELIVRNDTNCCKSSYSHQKNSDEAKELDDKLLVSIGGGKRDLLVHAGLTYSKYNDINVMTSAIPNVWLSTDHLASVWCLQLMLVISRFLFSIISPSGSGHKQVLSFTQDKAFLLAKASHYFQAPKPNYKKRDVSMITDRSNDEWFEDSRRVFTKDFTDGLNHTFIQMIPLTDKRLYKKLYADVTNLDTDDWVFGCDAKEFIRNMKYCSTGHSISHHVEKLPNSHQKKMYLSVDLHKIKKTYPNWTHVVLRLLPTKNKVKLHVDIHDQDERTLKVVAPRWYSYTQKELIPDTPPGIAHYKILVSGLDESFQSVKFFIKPRVCSKPSHNAVTKTCVPWVKGFERYQNFSEMEQSPLSLVVPISKPLGYNTTVNPVTIDMFLDPNCRYEISYQNSFGSTMSRIVLQYSHWLPAHITAVLLLAFKYQVSLTPIRAPFKCGQLHSAIVHSGSFFIITITRIFSKLLESFALFPEPDNYHSSLVISFVIHGSASALVLLSTAGIWTLITFYGNVIHSIFLRLTRLSSPVFSVALPVIERFPLVAGGALIAIAFASCGGVALLLATLLHFILVAKQYEDYLEQFVFDTMATISKRLFGRTSPNTNDSEVKETPDAIEDDIPIPNNNEETKEDPEEDARSGLELCDNSVTIVDEPAEGKVVVSEEDEELERLLNEAIEKQHEALKEKQEKRKEQRKEYDSMHEGLSAVHFHMTLFLLMCVLTILFVPTIISWARDFRYSNQLSPDPSIIPATIVIACVFLLWQLSAPRNIFAYTFVASILYVGASVSIIYCQDSVYRLSGVISAVFVLVTAHQMFSPVKADEVDFDPDEAELKNRIERMKEVLNNANENSTVSQKES